MIRNYFKTAWRNIWKKQGFSAINIFGLAVGMAACIVILLFVYYERSFDNLHIKNIYRLNEVQKFEGMGASQKVALSMFPMGPTLKADFPEVKNFTRVRWQQKFPLNYGLKRVYMPQVFFRGLGFLKMFDFKLLRGDRATALLKPRSVLLTEDAAKRMFGNDDPIGKTITNYGQDTITYSVTGILANVPKNSQLQFDCLFSFSSIYKPWMFTNWGGNWLNTYLELAPGTNVAALEKKFPAYLEKYRGKGGSKSYELFLLSLKDVHSNSADIGLDYINYQKFDKHITNLFTVIGIIVLVIACINFINLSTARSSERAKEVGVRKSIGAGRIQLAMQFLGETVLLSLIALIFACALVTVAIPFINGLSQRDISLPLHDNRMLIGVILISTVLVGIVSGIYPALFLSSFKPVKVLKGALTSAGGNKVPLRNILVVGQFTSAVILMIATVLVIRQLKFMQKKDPGFNRDQIVNVPLGLIPQNKYDLFKQELLTNSMVQGVTASQDILGSHLDQTGISFKLGDSPLRQLTSTLLVVDNNYLDLYKIKLLTGKNFSTDTSAVWKQYVINEALAKELLKDHKGKNMESLLGQRFGFDSLGVITGIAKDFNFNSLHYKIETLFLVNGKGFNQMSVKINGGRAKEAVAFIQSTWQKEFPGVPFEYQFLDEHFKEVYSVDNQVSTVVSILAGLIIIISCLGLFGLASYSAEKRIKEIGVRKVLGASVQNIVLLLSGHFVKLVLIANVIAWPIAFYAMSRWLQDFAYRIDISWWVFGIAGFTSLVIAFATVSFQAIKAAIANPVKSLRSE